MKKKNHGGARKGAGRKPTVTDKKVSVTIHPLASEVDALGIQEVKRIANEAVKKAKKKLNK